MKPFFATALISALLFSVPAQAQNSHVFQKPGTEVVNETLELLEAQRLQAESKKGYIKPQTLFVSVVDYDYFEDDQFGILLKTGDIITGCWELSPLEYEASFTEQHFMDVKVNHYKRDPATGDCPTGNQTVSALIVLNKSDLQGRGIKQIRFSNVAARDRYDISFFDDRVELKPLTTIAFKPEDGSSDKIVHYDSAQGVIALHVPMAKPSDNVSNEVLRVARQNNLSPLDQSFSEQFKNGQSTFFFMDDQGTALEKLGNNDYIDMGVVPVKRPYDGPYGRTTIEKPLKVFATKPGKTL